MSKKCMKTLILTGLLTVVMGVSVYASSESSVEIQMIGTNQYEIQALGVAEERYTLVIVEAGADIEHLTGEQLLYASAASADLEGVVTFEGVQLKVHRTADVYISGAGNRELLAQGIQVEGTVVSGQIMLDGRTTAAGAWVEILKNNGVIQKIQVGPSGVYTFDAVQVESDATYVASSYSYELVDGGSPVWSNYLYTQVGITMDGDTVDLGATTLSGGDVDGDFQVTPTDLHLLLQVLGKSGSNITTQNADINGDNVINSTDATLLGNSFLNKAGGVE